MGLEVEYFKFLYALLILFQLFNFRTYIYKLFTKNLYKSFDTFLDTLLDIIIRYFEIFFLNACVYIAHLLVCGATIPARIATHLSPAHGACCQGSGALV